MEMPFLQFVNEFEMPELTMLARYIHEKSNMNADVAFFLLHAYIIGTYKPSLSNEETLSMDQIEMLSTSDNFMIHLEEQASIFESVYQHMYENMTEISANINKGDVIHPCHDTSCNICVSHQLMDYNYRIGGITQHNAMSQFDPLTDLSGDCKCQNDINASPYASDDEIESKIFCPVSQIIKQDHEIGKHGESKQLTKYPKQSL